MSILGEPVGASILAFFLLGERLNAMQMIGSILVLFGVSVFLLQQQKEQQKCRKRACLYTGIIMLREKRSCDTSLLFYRNTGVEGEGNGVSIKKDTWLYPIFFVVMGACFAPIFAGREYFLLFFTIPLAIVFIWSWFSTKYIVGEETITIRSGFVKSAY